MVRLTFAALTALTLAPAAHAQAQPAFCPSIGPGVPRGDIERYFALRSIEIVRAGMAGDAKRLRAMVSPQAMFVIWRGDAGGGRLRGADGLIEMARSLNPHGYQFSTAFDGPIGITFSTCSAEADILFRVQGDLPGVAIKFRFEDGILVGANGRYVDLTEGTFP